jgi:putative DeoR family transcriptional regulator (stage III sporulation protein D)
MYYHITSGGRVCVLKGLPEERAVLLAQYIIEHNATVRQTAKEHNISKSTVHKDVAERLKTINEGLYKDVKLVLEQNKSERHIRGGLATQSQYERLRRR